MMKTIIRGENNEVNRLKKILDCYYFCDKTGNIQRDGLEKEIEIHLSIEEKEETIDGLISQERWEQ